ncbi:MAG: hypothetical protein FJW99_03990 [Actinobacteria bacterium]|nr:hypothetical protein [Actinomycetota bacterium]MBM3697556.1 hypothetical protein [Actinomycetota bacterium]
MLAVVHAVALRLHEAGVPWLLAGSAARLVRGGAVRPHDVDLEVREQDAARAARALGLPPPAVAEGGGWRSMRSQGAINGVPIDLSGGLTVRGPGGLLSGPGHLETVTVTAGDSHPARTLSILPDGEALARAVVSGDDARRARAEAALPHDPSARAAALAYAESRIAAAASAAR